MISSITNGQLKFEADGLGRGTFKFEIPSNIIDADADVMLFCYKGWLELQAQVSSEDYGFDCRGLWGLSFDGIVPSYGDPSTVNLSNFFGLVNVQPGNVNEVDYLNAAILTTNDAWAFYYQNVIWSGANLNSTTSLHDGGPNSLTDSVGQILPRTKALSDQFTWIWKMVKSTEENDEVVMSIGYNLESLSGRDMFNAASSENTVWVQENVTFTETDNWRAGGGITFPRWVMFAFAGGNPTDTLYIDEFGVKFTKESEL